MDAGLSLVNHLYRQMQVDAEWSVRTERGFTWWAGHLAQRVWAEPAREDFGAHLSRVHVQTDLLSGLKADRTTIDRLAVFTPMATMSGLILVEGGVRLASSVFVHEDTLEQWKLVLSVAAPLQVTEAHITARVLAEALNASPAVSAHPVSGLRDEADDMLNVIRDVFAPMGKGPSRFIGGDFTEAERLVGRQVSVMTNADAEGLTSEFPYPSDSPPNTAMLQMFTNVENPRLGSGLMMLLSLPESISPDRLPSLALEMNSREASDYSRLPFLGSWCPNMSLPNTLSFVSFFPNALAFPGLPIPFLQYFAARAQWAHEQLAAEAPATPERKGVRRLFQRRQ